MGLSVLWRAEPEAEGEHRLLMLRADDAQWHFELVEDPDLLSAHRPSPEDLLVLYLGAEADSAWLRRITESGGTRVEARNPYWETCGITICDPDGYRLVLGRSRKGWKRLSPRC